MPGITGPVPKRTEQRRRVNKPEIPVTRAPSGDDEPAPRGSFRVPLPPGKGWHRTAKWWYLALRRSGQAQFYEVSDWMEAYVAAEILSEMLNAERLSAMLYGAWASHTARLMVTEGDRRRLRISARGARSSAPRRAG
jgi:hypothetical protein